jgi:hypothetical protein
MRYCVGEFSDGTVIVASSIAAAGLRPKEELTNRVTGGANEIAFHHPAFLVVFTIWPVGSYGRMRQTSPKASVLFDSGKSD